jgi:hypothetical protein
MLYDSFAHFKGEIQPLEFDVALFEVLHNSQRLQVVIEPASIAAHQFIELSFPCVAEGWVTDVVHQAERFHEFRVQTKRGSDGPPNLRDFERVRETISKVIGKTRAEDLGLGFQSPERPRVYDSVAVAGVFRTVRMGCFRYASPARRSGGHSVSGGKRRGFDGRKLREK